MIVKEVEGLDDNSIHTYHHKQHTVLTKHLEVRFVQIRTILEVIYFIIIIDNGGILFYFLIS